MKSNNPIDSEGNKPGQMQHCFTFTLEFVPSVAKYVITYARGPTRHRRKSQLHR